MLNDLIDQTQLGEPELVRRALKYSLPLFLSGEVNMLTLKRRET